MPRTSGCALACAWMRLLATSTASLRREAERCGVAFPLPPPARPGLEQVVSLGISAARSPGATAASPRPHPAGMVAHLAGAKDPRRRPSDQCVEDDPRLRGIDRRRVGPDAHGPRLAPGWPACRAGAAGVRTPARRIGPDARGHLARPLATSPKHGHPGPPAPPYPPPPAARPPVRAPPYPPGVH